jgi:hypothetical protein
MSIVVILKLVNRVRFVGKYFTFNFEYRNQFLIRRQRKYKPDKSPYQVVLSSMKTIQNGHLQFRLLNTFKSHVRFQLDIYTLEHNSLRVKINELNPLRKRYEVEHSLVGEPKLVK